MKTLKIILTGLAAAALLSGCALKQDDTRTMRVAKHAMNSPFYVVYGAGKLTELAIIGTLAGTAKIVHDVKEGVNPKDTKDTKLQ